MSTVCKTCGAAVKPGATRCPYCGGTEFGEKTPIRQAPRPQIQQQRQQNQQQYQQQGQQIEQEYQQQSQQAQQAQQQSQQSVGGRCDSDVRFAMFADDQWKNRWQVQRMSSDKLGIILTNTAKLMNPHPFHDTLHRYLDYKASKGVDYVVLDLKNQRVRAGAEKINDIIAMITNIYRVAIPDYLFIIGATAAVPTMLWKNKCDPKYDSTVSADLPYITLDVDSPWNGKTFNFDHATPVGRLPTCAQNDFSEAVNYLEFAMRREPVTSIKAFTYTAEEWDATGHACFDHLNPDLITCPPYTVGKRWIEEYGFTNLHRLDNSYNVLSFILHGSDEGHMWYGQSGRLQPIAFHSSRLPDASTNGYILSTGACYGAKPFIRAGQEYSMLAHAMANRCLAFVGSTRIAYGNGQGAIMCADIVCDEFIRCATRGEEFGESYLNAISRIVKTTCMDDTYIKTLAEYSLYGDPSERLTASASHCARGPKRKLALSIPETDESKSFDLMACGGAADYSISNFSTAEQAQITLMSQHITQTGKAFVMSNFSTMSDVEPEIFKVTGGAEDGYRAFYAKTQDGIQTIVKLHLDSQGNVKQMYVSR